MSSSPDAAPRLQRQLRGHQLFTLAFGAIIGVGWVIVLGEWLGQAGPLGAILGFAAGTLGMLLVGACYAEVAGMVPQAGGEVAYAREIFGVQASFAVGWLLAFAYVGVTIFEAISVGWVASALWPGVEGPVLYHSLGEPVRAGALALGLGGMGVVTYLNYRGAHSAARFQDVLTFALMALAVLFIAAGIGGGRWENLHPLFGQTAGRSIWPGILAVLMTAPFWFGGFNVIPQVMEERSPDTSLRSAGRVILISIALAGAFYCLVILAASMAQPWRSLLEMDLPAARAFENAFHSPILGKVVLLAALLGLLTTWNTIFIAASRILFALGRARLIPPALGTVHRAFGSPSRAVLFVGSIGLLGTLLGRAAILPIVTLSGTCIGVAFLVTCVGMIRLRLTQPERIRPYRTPGGLPTALAAVLASIAILGLALRQPWTTKTGSVPLEWILLLVWCGLGLGFWMLGRRWRSSASPAAGSSAWSAEEARR